MCWTISSFQSVSTQQTWSLVLWLTTRQKSHYHLSIHFHLCLSFSVTATDSKQGKNPIIIYLTMSLSISVSVSFHLFSFFSSYFHGLSLHRKPIFCIHPSTVFCFPTISLSFPSPSHPGSLSLIWWLKANLSIYFHTIHLFILFFAPLS